VKSRGVKYERLNERLRKPLKMNLRLKSHKSIFSYAD